MRVGWCKCFRNVKKFRTRVQCTSCRPWSSVPMCKTSGALTCFNSSHSPPTSPYRDKDQQQEEPAFSILSLTEVRPRSRSSNSSLSKMRKTSERDQIRACLFLTALRRSSERKEDLSGLTPLDFVQYPARLSYENGGDPGPTLRAIRLAFR